MKSSAGYIVVLVVGALGSHYLWPAPPRAVPKPATPAVAAAQPNPLSATDELNATLGQIPEVGKFQIVSLNDEGLTPRIYRLNTATGRVDVLLRATVPIDSAKDPTINFSPAIGWHQIEDIDSALSKAISAKTWLEKENPSPSR